MVESDERLSFERARALFSRASMIGGAYGSAFLNLPATPLGPAESWP